MEFRAELAFELIIDATINFMTYKCGLQYQGINVNISSIIDLKKGCDVM